VQESPLLGDQVASRALIKSFQFATKALGEQYQIILGNSMVEVGPACFSGARGTPVLIIRFAHIVLCQGGPVLWSYSINSAQIQLLPTILVCLPVLLHALIIHFWMIMFWVHVTFCCFKWDSELDGEGADVENYTESLGERSSRTVVDLGFLKGVSGL